MIKKKERERMAKIIYKDMADRLDELVGRVRNDNFNPAYTIAFAIGLRADIEESLKKLRKS